ncbi:MAG: Xaa-Pro dipeptidase [Gammaproteobacteria bacterium]
MGTIESTAETKISKSFSRHVTTVADRYSRALSDHGFDAAVIFSGTPLMQFLDDNTYPFKANPQFKNWVPLTSLPDSFIIYEPGSKPVLVYFQPEDFWHKNPDAPEGFWAEHFDIKVISNKDKARQLMPKGKTVFLGEWQERFESWAKFSVNHEALTNQLHYDRAWKTEYEIACMEHASYLGALGHRAAFLAFQEETSEYDIHLAYCAACEHTDEQLPYSNIIALNSHSAILHYTYRDTHVIPAKDRKSFLIDAGAGCNGYASDITRTYAYDDNSLFGELIDGMDELQRIICEMVKPKARYPQLHLDTHRAIGGLLSNAGVINISGDDAAASGLTSIFYPHGLGHYIGLQVHDVGGFMKDKSGEHMDPPEGHEFLRLTRQIDVNQVMTIEPGIYIIDSLLKTIKDGKLGKNVNWDIVDQLRPYGGIRIEDNVVVTEGESRNLTREAFEKLDHHEH